MKKILKSIFLILLLIILLYLIPTPYYLSAPGVALSCDKIIKIAHFQEKKFKGKFYLTTVYYTKANLLLYLYALLSPGAEIKKPEGGIIDQRYYDKFMDCEMEESKLLAKVVALRELGYKVSLENCGVKVIAIDEKSKCYGALNPCDIILKVNKREVKDVKQLNEIIRSFKPANKVLLTIKRKGKLKFLEVLLIKFNKFTAIGIYVSDAFKVKKLPVDIKINVKYINGSSAGLMFTLEILRKISKKDIAYGRKIAGTGKIYENGKVGEVTGIKFKLQSAKNKGAGFFLVPYGNFAEASSTSYGIVVIPVKDIKSALKKLREINLGKY